MTRIQKKILGGLLSVVSLSTLHLILTIATSLAANGLPLPDPNLAIPSSFNTFRDIVIPLANMGIGAIIAILLIWTIYPVINRNTETLREIATTLNVMSSNNLLLSQKLLDIIERQSLMLRQGRE